MHGKLNFLKELTGFDGYVKEYQNKNFSLTNFSLFIAF